MTHGIWNFPPTVRQLLHLFPEVNRIAQFREGNGAEKIILFFEYKGRSARFQCLNITLPDQFTGVPRTQAKMLRAGGKMCACSQPQQIQDVGLRIGFVEIVDAPDQTSFSIPPGSKILDVKIAYTQHPRGAQTADSG